MVGDRIVPITIEWAIIIVILSVGISAMALFYATQIRVQLRNLARLADVQNSMLRRIKAAYGNSNFLGNDETNEVALRLLFRVENLSNNLNRRENTTIQIDLLNEILALNDDFLRYALLRCLAEVCIEHGSIDVGKTAISHITDERVLTSTNHLLELEQRRISRLNLINSMAVDDASDATRDSNVTKFRR